MGKGKLLPLLLALAMVLSLLTACGNGTPTENNQPSEEASAATSSSPTPSESPVQTEAVQTSATESDTVIFTDSAGRQVEVPRHITRIAASGSMAQIVIFALAPDMLAGLAGKWADAAKPFIDPKYYNLPVLGQFYGTGDLNLEEIAAVDPQVIIDVGEAKSTVAEDMDGIMKQVGIPTVHIDAGTTTMGDAYRMLGKLLGMEDPAEVLAQYCEGVYNNTLKIMDKVGEDKKAKLVYCLGNDGLSVLAKGSYHAEVLDLLSNNLAVVDNPSSKGSGNPVDMEQLLKWDPDNIIFAPDSIYDSVDSDPTWRKLKAISSGNFYKTPSGPYNWMGYPPSVNRYIGMIWMTQILYPDIAQYDLYNETAKYYKLFYHCDLTREQFDALVTAKQ